MTTKKQIKLTKNQERAQYAYENLVEDGSNSGMPAVNQGQMVGVSYSCDENYIFVTEEDRSCGEKIVTAFRHPRRECDFAPWSCVPDLGRRVGVIVSE